MSTWIKLDVTWDEPLWISFMEPASRLAWIQLLCYMRQHGDSGQARALPLHVAARLFGLPMKAVGTMLHAAKGAMALVEVDGQWLVTDNTPLNPDPTAAERMRRYRERQKRGRYKR